MEVQSKDLTSTELSILIPSCILPWLNSKLLPTSFPIFETLSYIYEQKRSHKGAGENKIQAHWQALKILSSGIFTDYKSVLIISHLLHVNLSPRKSVKVRQWFSNAIDEPFYFQSLFLDWITVIWTFLCCISTYFYCQR